MFTNRGSIYPDSIGAYYKLCRADPARDPSRTTVRLLDSLVRLSQAHARLLFRDEVTPVDAVTVIRLMESSWGFGKIVPPVDLIRKELPIGPTREEITEVLEQLLLSDIVKDVQLEQVNQSRVEQYQKELAKKRNEATTAGKWDSLSTQRIIQFDERVLSELDNNKKQKDSNAEEAVQESEPEVEKRKPLEEGDLYSKYSFTQMRKNNVKKMRKESDSSKVDKPPEATKKSKSKKPIPEPDPKLKENLNNDQLDRIFSSLRQNFMSELSGATQPAKPGGPDGREETVVRSSQLDTNYPLASGRSRASREESFRTMLDVSCLLEDEDLDGKEKSIAVSPKTTISSMSVFENSDLFKSPVPSTREPFKFNEDHSLLAKPLIASSNETCSEDESSRFRFKRLRPQSDKETQNASTSTEESRFQFKRLTRPKPPQPSEAAEESESRYRFKRPPTATAVNPMLVSQPSDFDLDFDTEILAMEEQPMPSTSSDPQKRSLSNQTLNKIRCFEFVKGNVDDAGEPSKAGPNDKKQQDDSAYESQQSHPSSSSSSFSAVGKYWRKDVKVPELKVVATLGGPVDVDAELEMLESVDF